MVILDTNVLIDYLRTSGQKNVTFKEYISQSDEKYAISILTIQELFAGKSTQEQRAEVLILDIISSLELLPYTYEAAKLAGKITRDLGRPLGFPDAAIAGTAILNKAKLLTLNKKDFIGIKGLELV